MFAKSRPRSEAGSPKGAGKAKGGSFSMIGADVVILGDIRATVDLHIDGRVEGDVACATLVQGAGGHIVGAVRADQARLAGTIEGALVVKTLVIEPSARVIGDVTYESLSMAVGAHIDGRLAHIDGEMAVPQQLKLVTAVE